MELLVCKVTCKLLARSLQACWFGKLKFIVIFFVFSYLSSIRLIVWELRLMSFFLLLRLSYKVRCYIWTKFLCLNFNFASCKQWRTSHLVYDNNFTFYSNIHWVFPFHSHNFSAHFCGIVVHKLFVFFCILCMMIPHFAKASTGFLIFPFQLFLFYLAQGFGSFEVCFSLFVFVIRFTTLCMSTKNENEVCVLKVDRWHVLVGFLRIWWKLNIQIK